jgi:membrane protein YdbS with pleckstrin-like domain
MNNTSVLQQQFQLSSRKFWKKVLTVGITYGAIFLMLIVVLGISTFQEDSSFVVGVSFFFVALYVLIMFFYSIYVSAYIKRYYYSEDADFVTIKKGVFTLAEIHVQYSKIQDVYVDQDIVDRMLGLYDVHIASATMGSALEAHIDGVNAQNAEGLKNLLLQSIKTGGSGNAGNNSPAPATAPSGPVTINLSERFSSETYPIEGRWIYTNILQSLYIGFIFFFAFSRQLLLNPAFTNNFFLVMAGTVIICVGISIVYASIWRSNYRFEFTPEYIFTHEGIISRREAHTPYSTIQDVIVSQGIMERILGISSVIIQNAAGGMMTTNNRRNGGNNIKIPGQTLENANKIADSLKSVLGSKYTGRTGL